ncbi:response regulator transcription factor [Syntrophomonas palmitatica]|uniref:response regulator transcription factor n=1 Tax=Syntrophomonas palmitatica TaxID=402877 RepID=UPI0006CFDA84|nr:response regulator transcription factor [Syntrophomonas palmitatica]
MKKILIIEDEINIAELERDYLEIEGFTVEIESDGRKGLNRSQQEQYDLIILDLMLPSLDGFEICRRLRKTSAVPIIMISAKTEDMDKIRGLGLGADDYMIKPFSPLELVARVKAHIARYERLSGFRPDTNDELQIKGLLINKSSRRVFLHDQEIPFSSKEFDLLLFLAGNPNRVLSKEQIYANIWGEEALGDLSTVAVHIRKIREKIESDPSNPQYLETVWGAGYRFNNT